MTAPSENEKKPPHIETENDVPFHTEKPDASKDLLDKAKDISMDLRKFNLGSNTLGWCIFFMISCVILSLFSPDNNLVEEAFDAFKLIVMTILGYIFGSEKK